MGPPSSGGSTVGEALNILEGYTAPGKSLAQTVDAFHHFLEASRYAFADRGAYLADPSFFEVPLGGLLSNSFAAERRRRITNEAADDGPVEPGDPFGDAGGGTALAQADDTEGVSTTHLTVVDKRGMIVSYTFTIESTGGSGIVVPGWGFLLNNELTDFTYDDPEAAERARRRQAAAQLDRADDRHPRQGRRSSRSAPRAGRRSSRPCCRSWSSGSTSG